MEESVSKGVASVEKTMNILEYLHQDGPASLSTIAADLSLPKSTTFRHINTLEERGYVVNQGAGYTLSLRFLDLGHRSRSQHPEYQLAAEKVTELANRTGERAQFIVEENDHAIYVHHASGDRGIEAHNQIGEHVPIYASAAGIAILAELSTDTTARIIDQCDFKALAPKTITDEKALYDALDRTHERGYSINDEGVIEGLRAIGTSITGPDHKVIGGLSITAPLNRMQGERFTDELPMLLLSTANELELKIAYE